MELLQWLKRKCLPFFFCGYNFNSDITLVQPSYKYLLKMPRFLQVLSFGRAKGEEDPLFIKCERCGLSFVKSPFERFTFQSGVWYIQASHGPVLQWSSRDKCCQTWRCLLLASVPWASALPLVHRVGTMEQWSGWVVEGNGSV